MESLFGYSSFTSTAICGALILLTLESSAATFSCTPSSSGYCISDAITAALENDEPDTIELSEGIHRNAPIRRYYDTGTNCFPPIDGDITITGAGMDKTYIYGTRDGAYNCRAFLVTEKGSLTVRGLTITEAATEYSINGEILEPTMGAGIYNKGSLVFDQSRLTDNWALTAGGGIYNAPNAKALLQRCKIIGNRVAENHIRTAGSAVFNNGEMIIDACEITGNYSGENYAHAIANGLFSSETNVVLTINNSLVNRNRGGGISNDKGGDLASEITITKTTISYNFGGGIANRGGKAVIVDSTIAHNVTEFAGGGISQSYGVHETFLINSTVSGNMAMGLGSRHSGEPYPGDGGGIYLVGGNIVLANATVSNNRSISGSGGISLNSTEALIASNATIRNSIIAGNRSEQTGTHDCAAQGTVATFVFEGTNVTGLNTGCPNDNTPTHAISYEEIFKKVIGPLQDNGGPTQTHALIPLSPAIDAAASGCNGPDGNLIQFDQRGIPRETCDLGAYESQYETIMVDLRLLGHSNHLFHRSGSKGKLWIAMLSSDKRTPAFDPVREVKVDSIYAGDGAKVNKTFTKDVNQDGIDDLFMEFKADELGIECGDKTLTLIGNTNSGASILGSLALTTAGCKNRDNRHGMNLWHNPADTN